MIIAIIDNIEPKKYNPIENILIKEHIITILNLLLLNEKNDPNNAINEKIKKIKDK